MAQIPKSVRDYMARIGAKGGAVGKGSPERKEKARKAAQARWTKAKKP